jgi:hypothetical protein
LARRMDGPWRLEDDDPGRLTDRGSRQEPVRTRRPASRGSPGWPRYPAAIADRL